MVTRPTCRDDPKEMSCSYGDNEEMGLTSSATSELLLPYGGGLLPMARVTLSSTAGRSRIAEENGDSTADNGDDKGHQRNLSSHHSSTNINGEGRSDTDRGRIVTFKEYSAAPDDSSLDDKNNNNSDVATINSRASTNAIRRENIVVTPGSSATHAHDLRMSIARMSLNDVAVRVTDCHDMSEAWQRHLAEADLAVGDVSSTCETLFRRNQESSRALRKLQGENDRLVQRVRQTNDMLETAVRHRFAPDVDDTKPGYMVKRLLATLPPSAFDDNWRLCDY